LIKLADFEDDDIEMDDSDGPSDDDVSDFDEDLDPDKIEVPGDYYITKLTPGLYFSVYAGSIG
jgi:hypothetical protein